MGVFTNFLRKFKLSQDDVPPTPANALTSQGDLTAENVVVGTQIINHYAQSGGKARDLKAIERGLIDYLRSVQHQYASLRLSALVDEANPLQEVSLNAAYLPVNLLPTDLGNAPGTDAITARISNLGGGMLTRGSRRKRASRVSRWPRRP